MIPQTPPHLPVRALGGAFILILGTGFLALRNPATAQEPFGLSVVAGGGYEVGGPGASLSRSLTAAGFGDLHTEGSGVRVQYPEYYDAGIGLVFFLGGHYRFHGPFSVDFLVSNGSRGHIDGYDNSSPDRLLIRWSAATITSTGGVHVGPLRLGIGPTLNMIFWDSERNWSKQPNLTTPVLGGTALVTARLPAREVLVSLTAGYRAFTTAHLSPAIDLPIDARYETWFIGLTVLPRTRRY